MDDVRVRNYSSDAWCGWCSDGGLVEIGTRPEAKGHVPTFAPCPYCEIGARVEFPERSRPVWHDGYWQGRPVDIGPPPKRGIMLSQTENHMRARLLMRKFAGENTDPCEGLELPEKERITLLSQRLKAS